MLSLKERLDPLLKIFMERGPAGCACGVMQNGKALYEGYAGLADLETQKPIAPDTIYRMHSASKVITCTAALMLYERGLFHLNDNLEDYLPEFKNPQVFRYSANNALYTSPASRSIKIKDLFMMASGICYPGDNVETARRVLKAVKALERKEKAGQMCDIRTLVKALAEIPLAFDPGSHWLYGYSHDVIGAFIEVVSGKRFSRFLQDEIFEPLGMKDTAFRLSDDKWPRLCTMYNHPADGKLTKSTEPDDRYKPDALMESGGGGLLSTLADYNRFGQAMACGELDGVRLLSPHTLRLMTANGLSPQQLADFNWDTLAGYGYGLGVRTLMDPAAAGANANPGEFGWGGYAGTILMMDPKEKLSIVYMQQMVPNQEAYHEAALRSTVYGSII